MVNRLSRRGVQDWLAQRVTAIIIFAYTFLMMPRLFCPHLNTHIAWQALFAHTWVKVATLLTVASILWHAWIGLWTVFTDYVKSAGLRCLLQILVILVLAAIGLWALLLMVQ